MLPSVHRHCTVPAVWFRHRLLHRSHNDRCLCRGGLHPQGQALKARVPHVVLPDLNNPSFAQLSYTGAMKAVSEALVTSGPNQQSWLLAGSSMGGYIAALYASMYPTHVSRLVLLCPGFALVDRWESVLPAGAMDAWQREGSLAFADGQVCVQHR